LVLPQIADAMTTAKLAVWIKKEGDRVNAGEPVVEVETDKTTVEIEAPSSGVLGRIRVPAGTEGVTVGTVLATIEEEASAGQPRPTAATAPAPPTAPAPAPIRPSMNVDESHEAAPAPAASGVSATPLAARMAAMAGVNLAAIDARSGRVTKEDVERALGLTRPATAAESTAPATAVPAPELRDGGRYQDLPLSPMRRVTASRLQQAKQTVPHFYLQADCRADAVLALRAQLNARAADAKITVTDLIVWASARALVRVPSANSAWTGSSIRVYENVDIAVAVNTPKGLITPVVRGCESKPLAVISRELAALAERARKGVLKPDEYAGGTFTISNLGMFGVTSMTPIINTPQACILGVGAIEDRAVVDGVHLVPGKVMSCTLASDHRAIDGATGAELLSVLKRFIENPVEILLGL
jgi:pyruvate dehydrogenase E2 component (dihydrolipoamide acetyltransferase)